MRQIAGNESSSNMAQLTLGSCLHPPAPQGSASVFGHATFYRQRLPQNQSTASVEISQRRNQPACATRGFNLPINSIFLGRLLLPITKPIAASPLC